MLSPNTSHPTPEPDYTILQSANWLNVTRQTVYNLIERGQLHAYKVGRATRITRESIEQLRLGDHS